eukprot:jgi/Botrbrau1/18767/Bobra.0386s0087.2
MGFMYYFLHGRINCDDFSDKARQNAPVLAGALFGAGWWCWLDAFVVSSQQHQSFPLTYHIPGWVATLSLICMNLVSRDDLNNMGGYLGSGDEGAETRAKIWLLISYFMAFGSVAGSVAVLVQCVQAKNNVDVGVGALLQCGFILTAALLFWAFRTEEDSGYGLIY